MLRALPGSLLAALLSLAAAAGCARSASVRAAEAGSYDELRRALTEELRRGSLDSDEARAIARAVAEGEIARAAPPRGVERLGEVRTCARHVEEALAGRAAGSDGVAVAAALILLEAGLTDAEGVKRYAAESAAAKRPGENAALRALAARALIAPGDGAARRARMLDGDQEVRVSALRAAIAAADPADRGALLEAARLDPYPLARTLAIRASGALGGEVIALALRDLWVLSDEPRREAIAEAWAAPRVLDAGGRAQLHWAISTQRGAPAIAAARALVRTGGADAGEAVSVLVRAIGSGPGRDRVYAILSAPLEDAAVRAALAETQGDPEDAVAFAAHARYVEASPDTVAPRERAAAIAWMMKLAAGASTRAVLARGVLARAGVRQAVPLLERDLRSREHPVREAAGIGLVELGELPRAALLLADAEPHVRLAVACAMLRAS
ncbi:hypothetical protein SOCE26_085880 [Sorangium cellulosum]|uniref:HEAT repeat domain-containing protein n=1 Tax=Sorangium cellulosum TaxID=56 RepID=A0A2L0F681_SORCE|nr:hypothetical protein [Sorangium cellulosum]AUX47076.1 hypothetical protein SOCE26_085880 [Sorangium cellulosum]